jgi:type II secretory pathway pseudopilin PulG
MHEPLLDRIRELERAVRRWRLVSFALALVVVSLLAIGGTFGLVLVLRASNRDELHLLRAQEQAARVQAEEALRAAEVARQQAEQARRKGGGANPPAADEKGPDEPNP